MTTSELFLMLEKKNINIRPDDADALRMIMRQIEDESGALLARAGESAARATSEVTERHDGAMRLVSDAYGAVRRARASVVTMLDEFRASGILREYSFAFSAEELRKLRRGFARLCGELGGEMAVLSASVGRMGVEAARMSELARRAHESALELKYAALADELIGRSRSFSEPAEAEKAAESARHAAGALTAAAEAAATATEELAAALTASETALGISEVRDAETKEATPGRFFAVMSKCAGVLDGISSFETD